MKKIEFNVFPEGKRKAVTFSYDDGQIFDVKLAEMFDDYGIRCTFNLNSHYIGQCGYMDSEAIRRLSVRHEIACHSFFHPHLENLPISRLISEIYEDKRKLEELAEKPVCGMAYPYGTFDRDVKDALRAAGILYSRTTGMNPSFTTPKDFLEWNPNCHHLAAAEKIKSFTAMHGERSLLYIWGHSYEFNRDKNWNEMEELLKAVANREDTWYATNLEIYDYCTAVKALRVSSDGKTVYNPCLASVYATVNGETVEFASGTTKL